MALALFLRRVGSFPLLTAQAPGRVVRLLADRLRYPIVARGHAGPQPLPTAICHCISRDGTRLAWMGTICHMPHQPW